jgi:transposase
LWTFDEHRIGLHAILGPTWAPKGQQPIALVQDKYEWLYLYAFVRPQTGQTWWYILPELSTTALSLVLEDFANTVVADQNKLILLQMDNAPWHTSKRLKTPDGIRTITQTPYSPELQPAERLWQLTDLPLKNHSFDSLDQLQALLDARCVELQSPQNQQLIKDLTLFHWWPLIS